MEDEMNKSKEFVLSLIRSGRLTGFPEDKAEEANTLKFADNCTEKHEINHKDGTVMVEIKYDPNADFDYCTVDYQMNDSTALFQADAFVRILNKMARLKTCYEPKVPDKKLKGNYEITYTIGDFVYIGYYDPDNAPEDKKWMSWNQKTALPIKFDIKKI